MSTEKRALKNNKNKIFIVVGEKRALVYSLFKCKCT